jgi:coenzyme F420-reducing hydrogenase delta subunit
MAIGPPPRTGRLQLQASHAGLAGQSDLPGKVVVLVCAHNDLRLDAQCTEHPEILLRPINCSGALHTSVIEQLLRLGARGVGIVSCPGRNCVNREGPKWLFERVYNDREAELPRRVDRDQICLLSAAAGERLMVWQELAAFRRRLSTSSDTPTGPGPLLAHQSALRRQARLFLPRLVVTVGFLALLAVGNRTPVGHAGTEGVLRLAWRLPGEKLLTCRNLSAAELDAKPLHMRQARECQEHPLSYRLLLTLNGELRLHRRVVPAGARGDRPLYVQEEVPLPAGAYEIAVHFTPLLPAIARPDTSATGESDPVPQPSRPPRSLELRSQITIGLDQITLVHYDDKKQTLAVMDRTP